MNDKQFKLFKLMWGIIIAFFILGMLFKISWPTIKEQFNDGVGDAIVEPSEAGGWETPRQNPEKP